MDDELADWNKRKIISRTVILTNLLAKGSGQRQRWQARSIGNEKLLTALIQVHAMREKHPAPSDQSIVSSTLSSPVTHLAVRSNGSTA